jgi:tagaturonate reductase
MEDAYVNWLSSEVVWLTTLVDRIVSGRPAAHPLLEQDPLLTVAEPYAFWAIEDGGEHHRLYDHPAIQRVPDVTPFALRKVRILNGAHTALVAKALPMGIETVREAVAHPDVRPWLERLLEEEIVPVVTDRVADAEGFAATILERFENPFLDHRLSDIALHHETKVAHRLRPTYQEYVQRFGEAPTLLAELVRSGG